MAVWEKKSRSLTLCKCLDFALTLLPNFSDWLSACVSVERTFAVVRGALFNKQASIDAAKRLCVLLWIVFSGLTVPEILDRQLIEDPRIGQFTWCITKVSSKRLQTFKKILSMVHLLGPFFIYLLASSILIVVITRKKLTALKDNPNHSFATVLRRQISSYKSLIISPMILLVLALPCLIISLGSLCMDTSWRNYGFLPGYFISFTRIMTILFVFVVPAPVYRDELKRYFSRVRSRFIYR